MLDNDSPAEQEQRELVTELDTLRRENALLRRRTARLERELASMTSLVDQAKRMAFWDFTPYEVNPDDSWLAVDRDKATALMTALAHIDHWNPWDTTIDPRPQP